MSVLDIVLLGAAVLGVVWGAVLVHEGGHYIVGRWLGVPADSIRIRLANPPHAALRQGDEWLSPDDAEYASTFTQHNPSIAAAWLFIAGGFLVETVVVLVLAAVFVSAGTLPLVIVGASTAVLVVYVVADVVLSARHGRSYADFTAMWHIARGASTAAIAVVLLLRAGAILLLI